MGLQASSVPTLRRVQSLIFGQFFHFTQVVMLYTCEDKQTVGSHSAAEAFGDW